MKNTADGKIETLRLQSGAHEAPGLVVVSFKAASGLEEIQGRID